MYLMIYLFKFIKEGEKNERTTPGIAGIHMHCRNIQFIKICLHPIYRLRMYTKSLGFFLILKNKMSVPIAQTNNHKRY